MAALHRLWLVPCSVLLAGVAATRVTQTSRSELEAERRTEEGGDVPFEAGAKVVWTSPKTGTEYGAVVSDVVSYPKAKIQYQSKGKTKEKVVEFEELADAEDSSTGTNTSDDSAYEKMNIRQKIVCDVCLRKIQDCKTYKPRTVIFNDVRPAPESPNGRYWNCPPSERELWTTDKSFKVFEDGSVKGLGDRSLCPEERRASRLNGKLSSTRRICGLSVKAQERNYGADCTQIVAAAAATSQGRSVTCTEEALQAGR
eukprot:TRINITY_DN26096_c0_g1_i1.p1 TRINITY_DN26096_c0_g1~~TRINITY_DN26096_c0_g1_i1.p1  ORF type:complete len:256 (+),score=44.99 TRINITY_DN26096_c0_g1_i1:93-860(+)